MTLPLQEGVIFNCFDIHQDGEYRERDIDVEICEAVEKFCTDGDGLVYKKIPAVKQAVVIMHHGSYDALGKSYSVLMAWLDENEYEIADNPRESYIDGIWNRDNPDDWRTEIQIPVKMMS